MKCKLYFALVLSTLLVSPGSRAADAASPVRFDGFATLGVVHSSEDKGDFIGSVAQARGAGRSDSWSAAVDSRIGLQLTARPSSRITGVVQVISEQRNNSDYSPYVEWANLSYAFTQDFRVRIGRTVLPTFMVSDYRKVAYANPWVRPPMELYGMVPTTNNDGIDLSYRFDAGRWSTLVQSIYGRQDFDVQGAGTTRARDTFGLFFTLEDTALMLRGGFLRSDLTAATVNSFFDAFRMFGPPGAAIAERYDFDGKKIELWTLGAAYDPGSWFVRGEWGRTESPTFLGTRSGWYATAGLRRGALTFWFNVAQRRKHGSSTDPGLSLAGLPPPLQAVAAGLNAELVSTFLNGNPYQSIGIGTRWDFRDNFSFKLQLDHFNLGNNSRAELINLQPGYRYGGSFNLISATLDLVF